MARSTVAPIVYKAPARKKRRTLTYTHAFYHARTDGRTVGRTYGPTERASEQSSSARAHTHTHTHTVFIIIALQTSRWLVCRKYEVCICETTVHFATNGRRPSVCRSALYKMLYLARDIWRPESEQCVFVCFAHGSLRCWHYKCILENLFNEQIF